MLRRRARRERTGVIGFVARWIRRIERLAFLASIVAGIYRWWQSGPGRPGGGGGGSGRRAPIGGPQAPSALRAAPTPEPEPELVGAGSAPQARAVPLSTAAPHDDVESRAWIEPLDGGACPASHPVKANDSSRIYHVPGGRFYDRTEAVRCYASSAAASADGYRAAKA
jgi:hypothetical protein